MLKFGHPNRRIAAGLAAAGILLLSVAATAQLARLRFNTSCSLPVGIYIATNDANSRLIEFCPAPPFSTESAWRGYRTRGTACSDGRVPLLKPIVAVAGDRIVLSADGIRVNGILLPKTAPLYRDAAGHSLRPWRFGSYAVEKGTVWVASTYNPGSYDSRYMGPIDITHIRLRLRPLWTL